MHERSFWRQKLKLALLDNRLACYLKKVFPKLHEQGLTAFSRLLEKFLETCKNYLISTLLHIRLYQFINLTNA